MNCVTVYITCEFYSLLLSFLSHIWLKSWLQREAFNDGRGQQCNYLSVLPPLHTFKHRNTFASSK